MINNYIKELSVWREERKLTLDHQKKGYLRNILEELGELAQGIKNDSNDEIIDALCDILVFSINCIDKEVNYKPSKYEIEKTSYSRLLCNLSKFSDSFSPNDLCNIYENIKILIQDLNYNFDICFSETLKEINSRKGYYDNDLKKWVKTETTYKANYFKAKENG